MADAADATRPAEPRAAGRLGTATRALGGWLRAALSAYAEYLARISWWRFFLVALLGLIAAGILQGVLPSIGRSIELIDERPVGPITLDMQVAEGGEVVVKAEVAKRPTRGAAAPDADDAEDDSDEADTTSGKHEGEATVRIDKEGIRVESRARSGGGKVVIIGRDGIQVRRAPQAPAASASGSATAGLAPIAPLAPPPPQAGNAAAEAWVESTNLRIAEANERIAASQAALHGVVRQIERDTESAVNQELKSMTIRRVRRTPSRDLLVPLYLIFVFASAIIKVVGADRRRAVARAGAAEAEAEREALRRQLLEARLQAMQAQVEPHFLFNTLASVEFLIETDANRAGSMLKSLIRYLRAALPRMREQSTTLGREAELVRAYLEILKFRMEERLHYRIDVPVGLASAQFPPMMLQSVVENAIKHGLEPKPEGGSVTLEAAVADGQLVVTVTDTGLGLGLSPTAGSGVGLSNLRERLDALYGERGRFIIESNPPGGTIVRMQLPYSVSAGRPDAARPDAAQA